MTKPTQVSKKSSVVPAPAPEVAKVPEVVEAVEVPEVEEPSLETDIGSRLEELKSVIHDMEKGLVEKLKSFKLIEQQLKKISIAYKKESKRKQKRTKSTSSVNHGFNAFVSISKDLADFLEVSPDTKFRRPQVTILISEYAKNNDLKNPENKGIYLPDEKLKKIFGPPIYPLRSDKSKNGYDMFNLQKYMKPHFDKNQ